MGHGPRTDTKSPSPPPPRDPAPPPPTTQAPPPPPPPRASASPPRIIDHIFPSSIVQVCLYVHKNMYIVQPVRFERALEALGMG